MRLISYLRELLIVMMDNPVLKWRRSIAYTCMQEGVSFLGNGSCLISDDTIRRVNALSSVHSGEPSEPIASAPKTIGWILVRLATLSSLPYATLYRYASKRPSQSRPFG